jgi:phosphatidylserine decarboxylase
MSIPRSIREAIPPIHPAGRPFIGAAAAAAVALGLLWPPAFLPLTLLAVWMAAFFRDPRRIVPAEPGLVVSPADGRVEPLIRVPPPPELGLGTEPRTRISVFMNVLDCHINRAPAAGRVRRVAYKPGLFVSADLDKASDDNERNGLIIETESGHALGVVQVAGLVARRILCWTREGERLDQGARFGMIRFGSRLDVYLPDGATPVVHAGQRAVGGETVLAILPGAAPMPPYRVRAD